MPPPTALQKAASAATDQLKQAQEVARSCGFKNDDGPVVAAALAAIVANLHGATANVRGASIAHSLEIIAGKQPGS